jgi:thioredoxin reductase (NADPH)
MPDTTHQSIVVGAGFAGLTAAIALAESGVPTALVDDGYLGGLITNVGVLEAPGPYDGLSGADLAGNLLGRAMEAGVDYQMGEITALEQRGETWHLPDLDLSAATVVLATGAKLRTLGVPGEERLTGLGVSQCAFCDGALYVGQDVAVVGGGDAAFQEALHLAEIGCSSVTLLLRGSEPRARTEFVQRAKATTNLSIRRNCEVLEILGDTGVEGVQIRNTATGHDEKLPVYGVFIFVGLEPQTTLAPSNAGRDATGALTTDNRLQTSARGLFAIGAARSGYRGSLSEASADAEAVARALAAG